MAARVRNTIGVPDVIVNCAGAGKWLRIEETSPEEAASMMAAPYLAAFNTTHAFMRDMLVRRSGTLVHVNSPACFFAWPASVGYTAARKALRGLHEALCQDLVGTGVQSCLVVFGRVDSPYFGHNPGVADKMPKIAATVRTLSTVECGCILSNIAMRPKRETIHPFMLRLYRWNYHLTPALVLWLLRATGSKRT
jgi:short-subunit dehydrogenase